MTKKEFDTYRFSVDTIVKYQGNWHNIIAIDFDMRLITTPYDALDCEEIEDIKK